MRSDTLDDQTLVHGLDAIARAHNLNYFADGHRGGALVSAHYFCREGLVEPIEAGVAAILAERVAPWVDSPLCAPFPAEPAQPPLIEKILATLAAHREGMRGAGHNVILPTLALKAFRDRPDLITPARVNGICQLIEAFELKSALLAQPGDRLLFAFASPTQAAESILTTFVTGCNLWRGRGNGWTGHTLTYGRAMLELHALGHADLARQLEPAFNIYLNKLLRGPQPGDAVKPEHTPTAERPHQKKYWTTRGTEFQLGHSIKYPYGYYGLMAQVRDPAVRQAAEAVAYQIF